MKNSFPTRPFTEDWFPLKCSLGQLDMVDLQPYDADPDTCMGGFFDDTKPLLAAAKFPELHIFSLVFLDELPLYVNRYVANADVYFLGKGNADPSIEIYPRPPTPDELSRALKHVFEVTAQPGESDEEKMRWVRFADNIAQGRPAFEGVLTKEERRARWQETQRIYRNVPHLKS